jgi:copper chaperone CopZ
MTTVTVAVEGMTCPTCETSIERSLRRIPEVHTVRANHVAGVVEVTLEGPAPESALRAATPEAGYDLAGTGASSAGG